ncbi:MAG: hypothetical protein KDA66_02440 [Planctomycetaceae bacterium]|nr:hypothetical protein [Planctomycetaceae bacterium]
MSINRFVLAASLLLLFPMVVMSQEAEPAGGEVDHAAEGHAEHGGHSHSAGDFVNQVGEHIEPIQEKASEFAHQVDQDQRAQEISAGILQPIYQLAESFEGTPFYWSAFTLMVTGVVSYLLQLVLGKLALLMKGKINLTETLSDAVGLVISVVGLVLTTQAAAQNSTFTTSPALVLSGAAVGAVVGFVMYRWGQDLELRAAAAKPEPVKK